MRDWPTTAIHHAFSSCDFQDARSVIRGIVSAHNTGWLLLSVLSGQDLRSGRGCHSSTANISHAANGQSRGYIFFVSLDGFDSSTPTPTGSLCSSGMATRRTKSSMVSADAITAQQDWRSSRATRGSCADDHWMDSPSMCSLVPSNVATLNTDYSDRFSSIRSDVATVNGDQSRVSTMGSEAESFKTTVSVLSGSCWEPNSNDATPRTSEQGPDYLRQDPSNFSGTRISSQGRWADDDDNKSDVYTLASRPHHGTSFEPSHEALAYHEWNCDTTTQKSTLPAALLCTVAGCHKPMPSAEALSKHHEQHFIKACSLCGGAYDFALKHNHRCKPRVSAMVHSAFNKISGKRA